LAGLRRKDIDLANARDPGRAATVRGAGVNLRELMERMGHSSTKGALVYLHSTSERQYAIAGAVSKQARAALRKAKADGDKTKNDQVKANPDGTSEDQPSGTKAARRRRTAS
jgi:hypothetical protein